MQTKFKISATAKVNASQADSPGKSNRSRQPMMSATVEQVRKSNPNIRLQKRASDDLIETQVNVQNTTATALQKHVASLKISPTRKMNAGKDRIKKDKGAYPSIASTLAIDDFRISKLTSMDFNEANVQTSFRELISSGNRAQSQQESRRQAGACSDYPVSRQVNDAASLMRRTFSLVPIMATVSSQKSGIEKQPDIKEEIKDLMTLVKNTEQRFRHLQTSTNESQKQTEKGKVTALASSAVSQMNAKIFSEQVKYVTEDSTLGMINVGISQDQRAQIRGSHLPEELREVLLETQEIRDALTGKRGSSYLNSGKISSRVTRPCTQGEQRDVPPIEPKAVIVMQNERPVMKEKSLKQIENEEEEQKLAAQTLRELIPKPLLNPLHIKNQKEKPDDFIFKDGKFRSEVFRGITRGLHGNMIGNNWKQQLKHSKYRKNYYPVIGHLQQDYSDENVRKSVRNVQRLIDSGYELDLKEANSEREEQEPTPKIILKSKQQSMKDGAKEKTSVANTSQVQFKQTEANTPASFQNNGSRSSRLLPKLLFHNPPKTHYINSRSNERIENDDLRVSLGRASLNKRPNTTAKMHRSDHLTSQKGEKTALSVSNSQPHIVTSEFSRQAALRQFIPKLTLKVAKPQLPIQSQTQRTRIQKTSQELRIKKKRLQPSTFTIQQSSSTGAVLTAAETQRYHQNKLEDFFNDAEEEDEKNMIQNLNQDLRRGEYQVKITSRPTSNIEMSHQSFEDLGATQGRQFAMNAIMTGNTTNYLAPTLTKNLEQSDIGILDSQNNANGEREILKSEINYREKQQYHRSKFLERVENTHGQKKDPSEFTNDKKKKSKRSESITRGLRESIVESMSSPANTKMVNKFQSEFSRDDTIDVMNKNLRNTEDKQKRRHQQKFKKQQSLQLSKGNTRPVSQLNGRGEVTEPQLSQNLPIASQAAFKDHDQSGLQTRVSPIGSIHIPKAREDSVLKSANSSPRAFQNNSDLLANWDEQQKDDSALRLYKKRPSATPSPETLARRRVQRLETEMASATEVGGRDLQTCQENFKIETVRTITRETINSFSQREENEMVMPQLQEPRIHTKERIQKPVKIPKVKMQKQKDFSKRSINIAQIMPEFNENQQIALQHDSLVSVSSQNTFPLTQLVDAGNQMAAQTLGSQDDDLTTARKPDQDEPGPLEFQETQLSVYQRLTKQDLIDQSHWVDEPPSIHPKAEQPLSKISWLARVMPRSRSMIKTAWRVNRQLSRPVERARKHKLRRRTEETTYSRQYGLYDSQRDLRVLSEWYMLKPQKIKPTRLNKIMKLTRAKGDLIETTLKLVTACRNVRDQRAMQDHMIGKQILSEGRLSNHSSEVTLVNTLLSNSHAMASGKPSRIISVVDQMYKRGQDGDKSQRYNQDLDHIKEESLDESRRKSIQEYREQACYTRERVMKQLAKPKTPAEFLVKGETLNEFVMGATTGRIPAFLEKAIATEIIATEYGDSFTLIPDSHSHESSKQSNFQSKIKLPASTRPKSRIDPANTFESLQQATEESIKQSSQKETAKQRLNIEKPVVAGDLIDVASANDVNKQKEDVLKTPNSFAQMELERMRAEAKAREQQKIQEEEERQRIKEQHELVQEQARLVAINQKRFMARIKPKVADQRIGKPKLTISNGRARIVDAHEKLQTYKALLESLGKSKSAENLAKKSGHYLV